MPALAEIKQAWMSDRGLVVIATAKLQLPQFCAMCGAETLRAIALDPAPGDSAQELLNFVGGPVGDVLKLARGHVKIPCCRSCRQPFRWGTLGTVLCLLVGAGLFAVVIKYMYRLPEWLQMVLFGLATVLVIGCAIPQALGQQKALPVTVYYNFQGEFVYLFSGGIHREWAEKLVEETQPPTTAHMVIGRNQSRIQGHPQR